MPPTDRRFRPDLTRALPGDDLPPGSGNGYRPVGETCEVLFGDGNWGDAKLLSWRRDRLGRWVAQIEWHAQGGTWTESYIYTAERLRPG